MPMLRPWLCSGRAARFLWVCAAGEPDSNLRLTLTPEGTWPSFLDRRPDRFLYLEVAPTGGPRRWITGFDGDPAALLARLAPGCSVVLR